MPDDVARAVGAGGRTITIAGKQCTVRPLGIRELTEVERDCLSRFKHEYLRTYQANLELLPEQDRIGLLDRKLDEVARWDVSNLPSKWVTDSSGLLLNAPIRSWLKENIGDCPADEGAARAVLATALDQGMLPIESYKNLTGSAPPRLHVPYVNWWITGAFDGMISFIWTCFKPDGVTREDVVAELGNNIGLLSDLSHAIEHLSAPAVGNG